MGKPPDDRTRAAQSGRVAWQAHDGLDGPLARALFSDAATIFHRHIDALNAINVFPVPDGDTGTNMHLTLRAGVEELSKTSGDELSSAVDALAHGALMGARGNSGVILSQVLHGFAVALRMKRSADGADLVEALRMAKESAYAALSEPVEGTILTVIREAAEAVQREPSPSIDSVLATAVDAAKRAVERTPELLPALKEAGVVDAGGLGLAIVLEGLLRSLRGESLDVDLAPPGTADTVRRSETASLHRSEHGESGYCTEFMVSGRGIDPDSARTHFAALGSSLLVVGGADLLRVHLHTTQPDDALAYGRSLGELTQVKVDNLEAQIESWLAKESTPPSVASGVGFVAVASGEGIEQAFRGVGVTHFVEGGQTMNPSAGEILEAIESCAEPTVVVLPNNKNIIAAAQQAAEQSTKRVAVIPSRSIPQGVAALLALNPDLPFEENTAAMERALTSVRSAEVTRAVRATTIDGQAIAIGQAIGIIDGKLRVVAEDVPAAVTGCIAEMRSEQTSLLTLYTGHDVRGEDASELADDLGKRYTDLQIDLVPGGQPHYHYILSLE